jgi:hypothetical protein
MDNDILIDEARRLYTVLSVEQYALSVGNKARFDRFDRLVDHAYCRYQRRLNRCVICYQEGDKDFRRDMRTRPRKTNEINGYELTPG